MNLPSGPFGSVTQVRVNGQTPPAAFAEGVQYNAVGVGGIPLGPTTDYYYDQNGNLFEVDNPNGVITHYSYDYLNRMTEEDVENLNGNTPIMVFSEQVAMLNQGHKSEVIDTHYNADGTVFFQTQTNWSYDSLYRLTDEHMTVLQGSGTGVPVAYDDQFSYDGNNNRTQEIINSGAAIVNYTYNGDDQLLTETRTGAGAYSISYTYDANGNLSGKTRSGVGAETDSYAYNVANRMTTATINGHITTYAYDYAGVLASEITSASGGATFYLNDPNNPTGYSKAIQQSTALGGSPTRSFVIGIKVEVQADASGAVYFVTDSHGSTRALVDASGAVKAGQIFDYDAFGVILAPNAIPAQTVWLFGGDGFYDPATGWTNQLFRWRNGFWFTQSDSAGYGNNADPISLHKYLYAAADPVNMTDPSGHYDIFDDPTLNSAANGAVNVLATVVGFVGTEALAPLLGGISVFNGAIGGITNASMAPSGVSGIESFGIGFASSFATSLLGFVGVPSWLANGIGGAMLNFGNDYLANGSKATSWTGISEALGAGLLSAVFAGGHGDNFKGRDALRQENNYFKYVMDKLGITNRKTMQEIHYMISGEGFSKEEIMQIAKNWIGVED